MLSIALSHAISEPRTMMIIRWHALLAQPAVPGAQRHINQALRAVPETNFNFTGLLAALDRGEVLLLHLLLIWLHLIEIRVVIAVRIAQWFLDVEIDLAHLRLDLVLARALAHLSCVLYRYNVVFQIALWWWICCIISWDDCKSTICLQANANRSSNIMRIQIMLLHILLILTVPTLLLRVLALLHFSIIWAMLSILASLACLVHDFGIERLRVDILHILMHCIWFSRMVFVIELHCIKVLVIGLLLILGACWIDVRHLANGLLAAH